jgi:hypothetical protein
MGRRKKTRERPPGDQAPSAAAAPSRARVGPEAGWRAPIPWLLGSGVVALVFLILKAYSLHPYAGDEFIYLFQARLVTEGVAPYSGFAMAHPPLQTLFTAGVFALGGESFTLMRLLPFLWCLAGGVLLSITVRRELGAVAAVTAMALFILAHEPLRASSHYTGVNMTIALLMGALLAQRTGYLRTCALLCAAAVCTRLYAAPGVLVLTAATLLADRRKGLALIGWGAAAGLVAFLAIGLWAGFDELLRDVFGYHAQKTPMPGEKLANMRDTVLFHNAVPAALFALGAAAVLWRFLGALRVADRSRGALTGLRAAVAGLGLGLPLLGVAGAATMLGVLLGLDRVWMYYFIPAFPFAAIAGGWLVSRWVALAVALVRSRGRLAGSGVTRRQLAGALLLLAAFGIAWWLAPLLETRLAYFEREQEKPEDQRATTYTWRDAPVPGFVNGLIRAHVWGEERVVGERASTFAHYLWHESRVLTVTDAVVEEIRARTGPDDRIFGDSGTVPLFALLSGRGIAGNEVDTNVQRFRSGNADAAEIVSRIDAPSTRLIILRHRFGVAGVREVSDLVARRYREVRVFRNAGGEVFRMYERKGDAGGGES